MVAWRRVAPQEQPLRLALIEERAAVALVEERAAQEANASARGCDGQPLQSPKWTGMSTTSSWSRLEIIQRVVEEGLSAETLASSRPLLPVPVEFPQSFEQTVRFCRPEVPGLRSTFQRAPPGIQAAVPAAAGRDLQAHFEAEGPASPLSQVGWARTSLRGTQRSNATAQSPARLRRRPLSSTDRFSALQSSASLGSELWSDRSSTVPEAESGSEVCEHTEFQPQGPAHQRSELLRKCWTRSRSLLRNTQAQVQEAPRVK
mmetsp:Transcript_11943/g.32475  ORF Transcript_11943/g.32475 Transcript_11943/m.32475 type:complete len:260 (+) Transcript_11943:82-861(+)